MLLGFDAHDDRKGDLLLGGEEIVDRHAGQHLLWNLKRSSPSIWPDYAFDTLLAKSSQLSCSLLEEAFRESARWCSPTHRLGASR
jgi:hypothetical protein